MHAKRQGFLLGGQAVALVQDRRMKTAGFAEIPLASADNAILSEMMISTLRAGVHLLYHVTHWIDVNGIPIPYYHYPSQPIINYHPQEFRHNVPLPMMFYLLWVPVPDRFNRILNG